MIPILLLSACSNETVRVDLPIEASHRSLVLAVEDGAELDVYAFALEEDRQPILQTLVPSYIGSYEVKLTAFLYERALSELGFEEGAVLPATSDPTRPIPSATSTMAATIRGGDVTEWVPIDRPNDLVQGFRIPALPLEECVQRGGCFAAQSAACLLPCPAVPEPMPAALAKIPTASCAPGWEDLEVKPNVAACTPWAGGPPACTGDQTIFPGESSCHALGPGCPTGAWQTSLPPGPRIYVRAGATGGDGSQGAPLGSIQSAIEQAIGGEVIVIGAGTYRETIRITEPVTLYGACPEQTTIDGPGVAAITAASSGTSVQNLRITADDDGVELDSGASILIEDVIIEGTGGEGIVMVNASRADLRDVLIRDTGDTGIWLQGQSVLVGARVHVSNGRGGVGADHAQLTLIESLVRDSRPNANGDFGRGANIQNDATAVFRRTMFDNNHDIGIFVSTANAELDRVVVQRTKSRPSDNGAGFGLLIQNDAVTSVRNSWIDENHESNVYVFGGGATFEDTVVSHARVAPDNSGGFNLQIIGDSSATLRRVVAVDPEYTSINIGNGEVVQLEDVTVLGSGIHPRDRRSGDGIHIQGDANPALVRVRIEDTAAQAIAIVNAVSSARLSDIRIARAGSGDCFFCSGLCVSDGAHVEEAERILIEDVLGTGVYGQDQNTKLVVSDISISGTERSGPCVLNHNVRDVGRGVGLYSADGSAIVASKFLFSDNAESGAQIAQFLATSMNTTLDLSFGTIRNNPIGATILIEGYDTRRLANFVVYSNNETNLNYE